MDLCAVRDTLMYSSFTTNKVMQRHCVASLDKAIHELNILSAKVEEHLREGKPIPDDMRWEMARMLRNLISG